MGLSLSKLAVKFGCDLVGNPETQVTHAATLLSAQKGAISFFSNPSYKEQLISSKASAVVIANAHVDICKTNALISDDPYLTFSKIVALLNPPASMSAGIDKNVSISGDIDISKSAYIGPFCRISGNVKIGRNTYIGPGCIIEGDVEIGDNSKLIANVTLVNKISLGKRAIIHPGAVIGSDGFGNVKTEKGWFKIPQIGGVTIGDDVEIGANTTVDRGSLDNTELENGVRLDNLIQIGHNVSIGEHTAIAASAAIAGSVIIGKRCLIAGQVGIVGHIEICDDVRVNGGSVVTKNILEPGIYSGSFAADKDKVWKKLVGKFRRL